MESGWYVDLTLRTSRRSRFFSGVIGNLLVEIPQNGTDDNSWRENGFRIGGDWFRLVDTRQCISLLILVSRSIGDCKVKPGEE